MHITHHNNNNKNMKSMSSCEVTQKRNSVTSMKRTCAASFQLWGFASRHTEERGDDPFRSLVDNEWVCGQELRWKGPFSSIFPICGLKERE